MDSCPDTGSAFKASKGCSGYDMGDIYVSPPPGATLILAVEARQSVQWQIETRSGSISAS